MHKQIGIGTSKMPHMLIVNTLQGLESRLFISNALYLQMLLVLVKCLECWPSYLGTCMPCKCQVAGSICTRSGLYSKPTRSNNTYVSRHFGSNQPLGHQSHYINRKSANQHTFYFFWHKIHIRSAQICVFPRMTRCHRLWSGATHLA